MGRSIWDQEGGLRTDLSDREVAHKVVKWVLALIVVGIVTTFTVWGLGIVSAPWVGRQNVHRIINNPNNQIFQYEHFFTLNGDIHADASNIKTLAAQAAQHLKQYPVGSPDPLGIIVQTQANMDNAVTDTSTHCQGLVQQYNNDAKEFTKNTFLSHQLPDQEDPALCAVSSLTTPTTTGGQ